jgi:hypothetical protein
MIAATEIISRDFGSLGPGVVDMFRSEGDFERAI